MSSGSDAVVNVLVFGAASQIGHFLLPALVDSEYTVTALTRGDTSNKPSTSPKLSWLRYSESRFSTSFRKDDHFDVTIFLAPLPWLPKLIPELAGLGVKRVIAFGTTSRFYKTRSGDPEEQAYIRKVISAEEDIPRVCEKSGIQWTLFRPTLVYGCGLDRNITVIANIIKRFGFFPIFAGGKGLRQPVHAEDLAHACIAAIANENALNKAYNLSGGSTLTYRSMVEAVFRQLKLPVRTLPIPLFLFRIAIFGAKMFPAFRTLSTEMATRQSVDMCFSHDDAKRDFGFAPRPFALDAIALSAPQTGALDT